MGKPRTKAGESRLPDPASKRADGMPVGIPFQPGHDRPGPGRPKGVCLKSLVRREGAKRLGKSLEETVLDVWAALIEKAAKGDTQAIKLILDRICDAEAIEVNVNHTALSPEERQKRINEILETAARRRAGENHGEQQQLDGKRGRRRKG